MAPELTMRSTALRDDVTNAHCSGRRGGCNKWSKVEEDSSRPLSSMNTYSIRDCAARGASSPSLLCAGSISARPSPGAVRGAKTTSQQPSVPHATARASSAGWILPVTLLKSRTETSPATHAHVRVTRRTPWSQLSPIELLATGVLAWCIRLECCDASSEMLFFVSRPAGDNLVNLLGFQSSQICDDSHTFAEQSGRCVLDVTWRRERRRQES